MKKIILLFLVCLALTSCATTEDLRMLRSEFDHKIIIAIEEKVAALDSAVDNKLAELKAENGAVRDEAGRNSEALTAVRRSMAEKGADMADIRDNLQQLRGQLEGMNKDLAALATRANRKDEENKEQYKDLREKLSSALNNANNAVFKVNFIENFLGLGIKEDQPEGTQKSEKPREVPKGGKLDKESAYAAAYEIFKEGNFDKARDAFSEFLKQYPDTEYSDNAQFWIAECYYFEKKYENAILEYEKVAKNYPDGDKVSYALLKQGFSFLNLGDKASAKLILQRVIKDYPNTNQARTAKAKLMTIK